MLCLTKLCDNAYAAVGAQASNPSASSMGQDGEHVSVHVLSDLVKKIGNSIGENIVSCLKSVTAG